jgi:hypothetical protein
MRNGHQVAAFVYQVLRERVMTEMDKLIELACDPLFSQKSSAPGMFEEPESWHLSWVDPSVNSRRPGLARRFIQERLRRRPDPRP